MIKRIFKRIGRCFFSHIPTVIKTGILHNRSFLFHFFEIQPTSCTALITNRCNLKCVMCRQWREPVGQELSTENWQKIINDLYEIGIRNIHFTGGEPLLRNDLCELVRYSSKIGFTTGLTTNGLLLKRDVLYNLIDAGIRSIAISLDAIDIKYEELRGVPRSFIMTKNALFLLSEAKKRKKIDVYINFTLMKNTLGDFKDVKRLADQFELPIAICLLDKNSCIFDVTENSDRFWLTDEIDFRELDSFLNFLKEEKIKKPSSLILNFPTLDFIAAYFKDPLQKWIPCINSQDKIFIDPYGDVLGGCLSMGSFGNVNNMPLKELLKEEKYKRAKRNMFYKKCPGCSCGYLFNIQHFPSIFVKDFIFRLKYFVSKNA